MLCLPHADCRSRAPSDPPRRRRSGRRPGPFYAAGLVVGGAYAGGQRFGDRPVEIIDPFGCVPLERPRLPASPCTRRGRRRNSGGRARACCSDGRSMAAAADRCSGSSPRPARPGASDRSRSRRCLLPRRPAPDGSASRLSRRAGRPAHVGHEVAAGRHAEALAPEHHAEARMVKQIASDRQVRRHLYAQRLQPGDRSDPRALQDRRAVVDAGADDHLVGSAVAACPAESI